MNYRMRFCLRFAAVSWFLAVNVVATAATPSRGSVYLSTIAGTLYRVNYYYDTVNLSVSVPLPVETGGRGGGTLLLPDHRIVFVGAGNVVLVDPIAHTVQAASSGNNANTAALDPSGTRIWVGWQGATLSEVPLAPFGAGTPHAISGAEAALTTIAFTPANGVFYATGGATGSGNFGRIALDTFVTTNLCIACDATTVVYDSFTASLLVAGVGHVSQRDPAAPGNVLSVRDDSATQNYLQLTPTGDGHAIGTLYGTTAALVFVDYSEKGLIGDATSTLISVPLPTITDLSGAAVYDADVITIDGFESLSGM